MSAIPRIREAAVAGSFYPGTAEELERTVDGLLADVRIGLAAVGPAVRGVVAPHAGYVYSGPIAATAYAVLARASERPRRVIIAGPSHFEPLSGLAVCSHDAWRTPLGTVRIDAAGREALVAVGAIVDDLVHRSEHSLEVQVPFIQRLFPGVPVLPLAVGTGPPEAGAQMLAAAISEADLLVVSSDLSHYHDAATARRLDTRTAAAIESLEVERLQPGDACGVDALRVALAWCRRHAASARLLDLRNSADTAGDPDRVVGYGAFVLEVGERANEVPGVAA